MKIVGRNSRLNHKWSIDECIDFFKNIGYDGMELCFEDYHFNLRPDYYEDFAINHIVEKCANSGLIISSVGNHMDFACDDLIFDIMKKSIPKVRAYGTDILIIASPDMKFKKFKNRNEYQKQFMDRLTSLLDLADVSGVRLAIEPEIYNLISNTEEFLNLCETINRDNLVCNLDVGHAFLTDEDMFKSIRMLGDKIVHTHVEGMNRGEHMHLMPDEGDMDLKKVFSTLHEIGFDGAMSLDLYIQEYDQVSEPALKYIRSLL